MNTSTNDTTAKRAEREEELRSLANYLINAAADAAGLDRQKLHYTADILLGIEGPRREQTEPVLEELAKLAGAWSSMASAIEGGFDAADDSKTRPPEPYCPRCGFHLADKTDDDGEIVCRECKGHRHHDLVEGSTLCSTCETRTRYEGTVWLEEDVTP